MLSKEPRCIYRHNQLADVICQLRFPEILTIETQIPAEFQDMIRDAFPQYSLRRETPAPKLSGTPGSLQFEKQPQTNNYQFTSEDGLWKVNLTAGFISLTCSRYSSWEDFAGKLDKPLAAFIKLYRPAYFERIGLRYLNFISRNDLFLEGTPFSELIQPCYLGPLSEEDVVEQATSRCSVDAEIGIGGGCRVKLHAGPGFTKRNGHTDREVKFIFDQDLFMPGKIPVNLSAGVLSTLHSQAFSIFRGAIKDTLHDAMEPKHII